jgi:hypothetical protein
VILERSPAQAEKLAQLRSMYEPYVHTLADRLMFSVPQWIPGDRVVQNWRTSAWEKSSLGVKTNPFDQEHS